MTTQTKKSIFHRPERPYVHPYFGGMVLGIILFLAILFTGNGLGSSGATARIDAALVDAVSPSHVDNNPYLLKMAGGDKNPFDDWILPCISLAHCSAVFHLECSMDASNS